MKPLAKSSAAFQTHAKCIESLQADVQTLVQAYLSNFIHPEIIHGTDDILTVDYRDRRCQLTDDELGIGTSPILFLLDSGRAGTSSWIDCRKTIFQIVCEFYETAVVCKVSFH